MAGVPPPQQVWRPVPEGVLGRVRQVQRPDGKNRFDKVLNIEMSPSY